MSIFIYLSFLIYSIVVYYEKYSFNQEMIFVGFLVLLISTFIFIFTSRKGTRSQYFRFSMIFIFGYIIVHFQLYIDYLLNNYGMFSLRMFTIDSVGMRAYYLSLSSILAFYIGYYVYQRYHNDQNYRPNINIHNNKTLISTSVIKIILLSQIIIYFVFSDYRYFIGNYGTVSNSGISTYVEYFLNLSYVALIVSIINNSTHTFQSSNSSLKQYLKTLGNPVLILMSIYAASVIASGDRGYFLNIAIVSFLGYLYVSKKKIGIVSLISIATVSIVLLFVLGVIREQQGSSNLSYRKITNFEEIKQPSVTASSWSQLSNEYARSLRSLHGAIMYVSDNGLNYGEGILYSIMGIIPGLGRVYKIITHKTDWELVSSKIITKYLYGDYSNHGLGTTCVADLYLDMGYLLTVVCFLFFGMYSRFLDTQLFVYPSRSVLILCMIVSFYVAAIYIPRSSIIVVFREGVIIYLIIMLSEKITGLLNV
jgi:oligosaccharide repeat unit polymerase